MLSKEEPTCLYPFFLFLLLFQGLSYRRPWNKITVVCQQPESNLEGLESVVYSSPFASFGGDCAITWQNRIVSKVDNCFDRNTSFLNHMSFAGELTEPNWVEEETDLFLHDDAEIAMEPIKGDADTNDDVMFADPRRRVGFSSTVSIIPIPSRLDYPAQVRSAVWSDKKEISEMTARNMVEFAAEGWDWRNATEEEHMLFLDGVCVHPVHGNFYLRDALQRQIPYPRAVTPPDDDRVMNDFQPMQCEPSLDRGAVEQNAEIMERPDSPFVESVVFEDCDNDYDEVLLINDPDQFLRQRFAHRPRKDVPFGDSEDAYYTKVLYPNNP